MRRLILFLLMLSSAMPALDWHYAGVPDWVLPGVVAVETSSFWRANGEFVYVNRKRGRHGERGPTQMTRAAFDTVALPGEKFERLQTDMEFAMDLTIRYLLFIRQRSPNWDVTLARYNAGLAAPGNSEYSTAVREIGQTWLTHRR